MLRPLIQYNLAVWLKYFNFVSLKLSILATLNILFYVHTIVLFNLYLLCIQPEF